MNFRSLSLIVLCHGIATATKRHATLEYSVAVMYGFTLWSAIAKS